ncbi:MAG: hypothetical protein ACI8PZ_003941 [Myxococcota bacterium]
MHLTEIARTDRPPQLTFMRDYVAAQQPIVIRGEMDDWEAIGRWSPADLRARCADRTVPVTRGPSQLHAALDRMIDAIEGPVDAIVPELAHEVRVPQFVPRSPLSTEIDHPTLWIGGAHTSSLRFEPGTEQLVQAVYGTTTVRLFPMSEAMNLYRRSTLDPAFATSPVDAWQPDAAAHPRASQATGFVATLAAGEMLYVPPMWWRSVGTSKPSIRLTTSWRSLTKPPLFSRTGLATRVLPRLR